jgi:hypothetical protein
VTIAAASQSRQTATIVVPIVPPVECSPNFHGHWRKRRNGALLLRTAAKMAAVDALNTMSTGASWFCGCPLPVVIDIEIAWNGRRSRMDDDNAKASCKALIDGISDALWGGYDGHVMIGTLTQTRGDGTMTVRLRPAS